MYLLVHGGENVFVETARTYHDSVGPSLIQVIQNDWNQYHSLLKYFQRRLGALYVCGHCMPSNDLLTPCLDIQGKDGAHFALRNLSYWLALASGHKTAAEFAGRLAVCYKIHERLKKDLGDHMVCHDPFDGAKQCKL